MKYLPTGTEALLAGYLTEGWGAADLNTGTAGFANLYPDNGGNNLTLMSFTSTATTASSRVRVGTALPRLEVTHTRFTRTTSTRRAPIPAGRGRRRTGPRGRRRPPASTGPSSPTPRSTSRR